VATQDGAVQMSSVAIVIPAYNAKSTLGATISSVLNQTLADFELIVIDDGSSDTTYEIAQAFARQDGRVKAARQANRGLAEARNAGIRASSAPLVAAIDCDDIWHPTFLEKLSKPLLHDAGETLAAYANSRILDLRDQVIGNAPAYDQSGWVFNQLLLQNFIGNGSAMMFRRDAATQLGLYEPRLQYQYAAAGCEDWLLALKLSAHGKIAAVQEYLVGYRAVPGAMSQNTLRMRRSRRFALRFLFQELDAGKCKAAKWAMGIAHAKCFLHELRAMEMSAAFKDLVAALQLDPGGTLDLLFGVERVDWLLDKIRRSGKSEVYGKFGELDTRDGQWQLQNTRADTARRWDSETGRIAMLRTAGTTGFKGAA
jgi:glycosyltransferase involved in cell wall biosynthesis